MTLSQIDAQLKKGLSEAEFKILNLECNASILRMARYFVSTYPGGGNIAITYCKQELQVLLHQQRVGASSPAPRNPLGGPRRGRPQAMVFERHSEGGDLIERVRVPGVRSEGEWRCPVARLSEIIRSSGDPSWLAGELRKQTRFILGLREYGFTGVVCSVSVTTTSGGLTRSPKSDTLSQEDTRIVLHHRGLSPSARSIEEMRNYAANQNRQSVPIDSAAR